MRVRRICNDKGYACQRERRSRQQSTVNRLPERERREQQPKARDEEQSERQRRRLEASAQLSDPVATAIGYWLNNVFGAHLHITSLRASQGPGVEFLEYVAPRTGRVILADTQANDLWYWQIIMRAPDPSAAEKQLLEARATIVSMTALHDSSLGWAKTLLTRDPDGHSTLIAAP